jgi:fused signal recognition particle receptor
LGLGFGVWDLGFLDRLREGLSRTKQQIVSRFDEIVQQADTAKQRTRPIDVDTIEALEELLVSADVGVAATERIVGAVKARSRVARACGSRQGGDPPSLRRGEAPVANGPDPHVTLIVGVNGPGRPPPWGSWPTC